MESEQELQAQLLVVNTAISKLIAGERPSHVEVGSGGYKRVYKFSEVTLENLQRERTIIQQKLVNLESLTQEPTYRTTAHHMSWSKQ